MYVDAMYRSRENCVDVVERRDGQRRFVTWPAIYEFYVPSAQGSYRSIFGQPLAKITAQSEKEFKALKRNHSNHFEGDLKPVHRVLEHHYLGQDAPGLHVAFFDIETDFDAQNGYSQPEQAANPITSIAVYLQWLKQVVCLAVPPPTLDLSQAEAIGNKVGNVLIYQTEREMLDAFLYLIEDADVLSGWNSEGYDIPYVVNRIHQIMGRNESRRLCLWNQMPRARRYERGGREQQTYDLIGRVHLDYLQLYKKFTYEERHSYSLNSIAAAELNSQKVEFEGTLDQLYREHFEKFLQYNIQDTMLLEQLDQKLQYIDLASTIAHSNTVPIQASLGAVAVTEQAIINQAHSLGLKVPSRDYDYNTAHTNYDQGFEDLESRAAGGWVQHPKRGISRWVGSSDLNSLYPSVIRAFNMSPETMVGQIRTTSTDSAIQAWMSQSGRQPSLAEWWNDRFNVLEMEHFYQNNNCELLTVDLADGGSIQVTGAELRKLVFEANSWCITANGTIFRTDQKGVVPQLLENWYTGRKKQQAIKRDYELLENGIEWKGGSVTEWPDLDQSVANWSQMDQAFSSNTLNKLMADHSTGDQDLARYMIQHQLVVKNNKVYHQNASQLKAILAFWDKRQLVTKILLNSAYGGLLNVGCRFYDKRIGQSTTLSGRSITKHMTAKTNELIDGVYDHEGRAVVAGDTDSVYFSAYPTLRDEIEKGEIEWNRDSVIALYDEIAKQVSNTFPEFLLETFNVPISAGQVVKSGREVVGETSIFITKKRYAILVYDEEGNRRDQNGNVGKLKITGLDIRRSDTPVIVQDFLRDLLLITLTTVDESKVIDHIRQFKKSFANLHPWQMGSPKAVNNLSNYHNKLITSKARAQRPPTIPGHVMASINWNSLRERHGDHVSQPILDGQKIVVCQLKPNDYGFSSIAYPTDQDRLPQWFLELPFDKNGMTQTILDKKIQNLLGVLNWDLSRANAQQEHLESLFDFDALG